jgi:hypothetical protein
MHGGVKQIVSDATGGISCHLGRIAVGNDVAEKGAQSKQDHGAAPDQHRCDLTPWNNIVQNVT